MLRSQGIRSALPRWTHPRDLTFAEMALLKILGLYTV